MKEIVKNTLEGLSTLLASFVKGAGILIGIVIFIVIAFVLWNFLFPDINREKSDCSVWSNTIDDWNSCLQSHNITPDDSDIRKQCETVSESEYNNDNTTSQNTYYIQCVRSQGLPN